MSLPLQEITDLASVGSALTCTLSAESVQVILFALSFLDFPNAWLSGQGDEVSETDWTEITRLLDAVSDELLP